MYSYLLSEIKSRYVRLANFRHYFFSYETVFYLFQSMMFFFKIKRNTIRDVLLQQKDNSLAFLLFYTNEIDVVILQQRVEIFQYPSFLAIKSSCIQTLFFSSEKISSHIVCR